MKNLVIAERSYIRKVVFSSKSAGHVNCAETKKNLRTGKYGGKKEYVL